MTVGRRQYNEAEMMQMQREAEARVREMQTRNRRVALDPPETDPAQRNRNWSTNAGMFRQRGQRRPMQQSGQQSDRQSNPQAAPPTAPPNPEEVAPTGHTSPDPPEAPPKKNGTIVGDIMDALGLDEDYLLIIGLILILVNQRADTTLILALAYLLI